MGAQNENYSIGTFKFFRLISLAVVAFVYSHTQKYWKKKNENENDIQEVS